MLTRQNVETLDRDGAFASAEGAHRGAYVLKDVEGAQVVLVGTGSEVGLALEAAETLAEKGVKARVVSMPSWELFEAQDEAYRAEGAQRVGSLVEAIEAAEGTELMVIGGGELYRQALPLASRMVLTTIDIEPECDTWFPAWDPVDWTLVDAQQVPPGEGNEFGFEVIEWMRH